MPKLHDACQLAADEFLDRLGRRAAVDPAGAARELAALAGTLAGLWPSGVGRQLVEREFWPVLQERCVVRGWDAPEFMTDLRTDGSAASEATTSLTADCLRLFAQS